MTHILVCDARDAHTQFVTHPSSCHIIHTHVIFRYIYIYIYTYTYILNIYHVYLNIHIRTHVYANIFIEMTHIFSSWLILVRATYDTFTLHWDTCIYTYYTYIHTYINMYQPVYLNIHTHTHGYANIFTTISKYITKYLYVYIYILIERNPPSRGCFPFTMFPHQEPWVGGPPSRNLYQVRGGSSYTLFLMREHSK